VLRWAGLQHEPAGAAAGMKAEVEQHIRATAASKGSQITVLKQGYLLKKNSGGLRREWKRRFFVLDSSGMLYYYSAKVGRYFITSCPDALLLG
jgi:Arf-GAP with coiled-coil, ANK repeat and PH domain-containing protein